MSSSRPLTGTLLDETVELSVQQICRACATSTDWVVELVDEGILIPEGNDCDSWRFSAVSLRRARVARRLQTDLGINIAGIALALDLLDEIARLSEPDK